MAACWLLGLASVASFCSTYVVEANPYIIQEDRDVADAAKASRATLCERADVIDVDSASARDFLIRMVGKDKVDSTEDAMTKSDSMEDVQNKLMEDFQDVGWILTATWPFLLAILMLVMCPFMTCSICPCCKCCRVCRSEHDNSRCVQAVFAVMALLLVVALFATTGLGHAGYNSMAEGLDVSACGGSRMTDQILSGQSKTPSFIGLLPVLGDLYEMESILKPDSDFMTSIHESFTEAQPVTDAVVQASGTIGLLRSSLQHASDLTSQNGGPGCDVCDDLLPILTAMETELEKGVGTALSTVQKELKASLGGEGAKGNQDKFKKATNPIVELKTAIIKTFKPFTNADEFDESIRNRVNGSSSPGMAAVGVMVAMAFFLCFIMIVAIVFLIVCQRKNKGTDDARYRARVHRCALCGCCYAYLLAVLALFFGGLGMLFAIPTSMVCVVVDGLTGDKMSQMSKAFEFEMTGDTQAIFDSCLFPTGPIKDVSLMDIIRIDGNQTMREATVGGFKKGLEDSFNKIQTGDTSGLANSGELQKLKDTLGNDPGVPSVPGPNAFKCDLFEHPEQTEPTVCHPADDDCVKDDKVKTFPIGCDQAGWKLYIKSFGSKLTSVFQKVDEEATKFVPRFAGALKQSVLEHIIEPIELIMDGFTCGWMAAALDMFVDGICFKGVVGLWGVANAYVAAGVFGFITMLVLYSLWRRTVDNYNLRKHIEIAKAPTVAMTE